MSYPRRGRKDRARSHDGSAQCDAGYCDQTATVDFGYHVQAVGIPGEVRFLCCRHARGLAVHRLCNADRCHEPRA